MSKSLVGVDKGKGRKGERKMRKVGRRMGISGFWLGYLLYSLYEYRKDGKKLGVLCVDIGREREAQGA